MTDRTRAVTAIVPTRNRRQTLEITLATVLAQRAVDLRVVVVDEGSSDDTPAYLAAHPDTRLRVVRHDEPRGLPAARNAGVAVADTPWVAFCDDDDLWAPEKVAAQLDAMAALDGSRWACTGTVAVDPALRIIGHQRASWSGDVARILQEANVAPAGGSSVMAATELVRAVGGFDESMRACEDYDLWCRLAAHSPMAAVDRPLTAYRVWNGSMSSDPDLMRTWHEEVARRYRTDPAAEAPGGLGMEHYLGRFHLRRRDRSAAVRHFGRVAVRYRQPKQLLHAGVAAVSPRLLLAWADRRERDAVPVGWAADAEQWLAPVRDGSVPVRVAT